ncbi:unnamed protein product [Clonostachys byssicola]|uniref:F-box domain-containing protein n=1 Tax=Clonostachys byssicola TaxID=160290 RepID=A0A9N9UA53_9HYPO|nr:unnamed protein product [Clonostachys byssicola]
MAPLTDAPNEIISHICGFVPKISDLKSLCLASRSLRSSAEPILYSSVILEYTFLCIPRIVPLLRTLLRRPELFQRLETVSMNGWGFDFETDSRAIDLESIDAAFKEQCLAAIQKTNVPFTELWIQKFNSGETCLEALYALLLANLSSGTKRLALMRNFINGRELIGKVMQAKAYGGLPALDRLKEIKYFKGYDYSIATRNDTFEDVISLFYLPKVTHIVAWVPNSPDFRWPAGQPNLDNLTLLDITRLSDQHMGKILSLTRNLKSLFWTWEYDDSGDPWLPPTLDFDKIVAILSNVRRTLTTLRFRLKITGARDPVSFLELFQGNTVIYPDIAVSGTFRGLAEFDRLTYLEVPLVSLPGFGDTPELLEETVPTNIKRLVLSEDMLLDKAVQWQEFLGFNGFDVVERMLEGMARNVLTRLPHLHRLILIEDIGGSKAVGGWLRDQVLASHATISPIQLWLAYNS